MVKIKKFLSLTLAAFTCLLACACELGNENSENLTVETISDCNYGLHELNYTTTNDYLIKDNRSDYFILIPEDATSEIEYAAGELQSLVQESTQVSLSVVRDNAVGEYSEDKRFISLGDTKYADAVDVAPTKELTEYGYAIKTVNKSIFISANSDIGVTFGVYGFLELQFNFDCFTDVYYVIDKVDDAPLLDFNVRDVADLNGGMTSSQYEDGKGLRRMRYMTRDESWAGDVQTVHSAFRVLPKDTYLASHPKWYSDAKTQLCYTAHGDAEELELMIQEVANKIIDAFKVATPNERYFSFGQMDEPAWCACEACAASYQKYNSNCPVQTQFINKVAEKVDAWMKTEEGEPYARDFEIIYLIYQKTVEAPVKYNEKTGEYEPIDETVIPADHTLPMLAPLMEVDHQCDLFDECNKEGYELLKKWKGALSGAECALYTYWENYTSYWLYYDSYAATSNLYKFYAGCNVQWFYEEGQVWLAGGGGTAWSAMRAYLTSKLRWNANLDIDQLTKRFFAYYYDEAADEMYHTFIATRAVGCENRPHFCKLTIPTGRGVYKTISAKEYWPEDLAVSSLERIEKGLSDIAYLKKTDPAKYQQTYLNIVAERLSYEYILIEFYADRYDSDYIYNLKLQAKKDAEDNNIFEFGQRPETSAADIWKKWGI